MYGCSMLICVVVALKYQECLFINVNYIADRYYGRSLDCLEALPAYIGLVVYLPFDWSISSISSGSIYTFTVA